MSELARAVLQFACETTIYACNRILEQLHAHRPLHDEPLPGRMECDGPDQTAPLPGWSLPADDTSIRDLIDACRGDVRAMADQTAVPAIYYGDHVFGACLWCGNQPCTCPSAGSAVEEKTP